MDSKALDQIKNTISEAVKNLATKDEVKLIVKGEIKNLASKDEVRRIVKSEIRGFATKNDLNHLATKDDLNTLEKNLKEYTDQVFGDLLEAVEKHKADRTDIERLEKQISSL